MTSREAEGGAATAVVQLAVLDDHELLLDSIASWIVANAPDFDLVIRATTWIEMVLHEAFPTHVVLMDFQLKESVSIEARIRTCRAAGTKVIVMSALDTPEIRERALEAGAATFLSKAMPMSEVMTSVRMTLGMNTRVSHLPARVHASQQQGSLLRPKLSRGETDALRLYVEGYSTAEVASLMSVKYETAKTYLRRVREKYARANRPASRKVDLIRRAAEDGYLE